MATRLTSEEFMAGIFAMLAQRNWGGISIRGDRIDRASAAAFVRLEDLAASFGVRPRFFVTPHPAYGESTVVRDAIARLAQWDLISLDNPEFQDVRLKMTPTYARDVLRRLKLSSELFANLTDTFVDAYEGAATEA